LNFGISSKLNWKNPKRTIISICAMMFNVGN
ncbi:hypothetical protein T01_14586, partial [Trichinella spiralis]